MRKTFFCALCLFILAGCGGSTGDVAAPTVLTSGIDRSNMDLSVRPQDDFYRYVNGTWLETAEIPADRTTTGVFRDLRESAREDVLAIIQNLAAEPDLEPGTDEQKVADLYNSFMDTERLEELGMSPLEDELAVIDGITDKKECRPISPAAG